MLSGIEVFFPNHALTTPPDDLRMAWEYRKWHTPVERDDAYQINRHIWNVWNKRPEAWTFEQQPWGPVVAQIQDGRKFEKERQPTPRTLKMPKFMPEENKVLTEAEVERALAKRITKETLTICQVEELKYLRRIE